MKESLCRSSSMVIPCFKYGIRISPIRAIEIAYETPRSLPFGRASNCGETAYGAFLGNPTQRSSRGLTTGTRFPNKCDRENLRDSVLKARSDRWGYSLTHNTKTSLLCLSHEFSSTYSLTLESSF